MSKSRLGAVAALVCCMAVSCRDVAPKPAQDLTPYQRTNGQHGHELVNSEQFIVPVGEAADLEPLEFEPGSAVLTEMHVRILREVFNSLEELTEDIMGDPDRARVEEFKKMEFEIRGYGDGTGDREADRALGEARAEAAFDRLTKDGTPSWRLKPIGIAPEASSHSKRVVEFIRLR